MQVNWRCLDTAVRCLVLIHATNWNWWWVYGDHRATTHKPLFWLLACVWNSAFSNTIFGLCCLNKWPDILWWVHSVCCRLSHIVHLLCHFIKQHRVSSFIQFQQELLTSCIWTEQNVKIVDVICAVCYKSKCSKLLLSKSQTRSTIGVQVAS